MPILHSPNVHLTLPLPLLVKLELLIQMNPLLGPHSNSNPNQYAYPTGLTLIPPEQFFFLHRKTTLSQQQILKKKIC